jgi:hypothetical protein
VLSSGIFCLLEFKMQVMIDDRLFYKLIYQASRCVGHLEVTDHQWEKEAANELWELLQEAIRTAQTVAQEQQQPVGLDNPKEV